MDTSAAINLTATGYGVQIAQALPNPLMVVDVVPSELEDGRNRGRPHAALLDELVTKGLVRVVTLDKMAETHFEKLVIGPAGATLDDGEAATIAYAVRHSAMPIIDERKATRICAEQWPGIVPGCTVDILAHGAVRASLGGERLARAALNALMNARMRVPLHYVEWIVELIGPEQAAKCHSLSRHARASISANSVVAKSS